MNEKNARILRKIQAKVQWGPQQMRAVRKRLDTLDHRARGQMIADVKSKLEENDGE